MEEFEFDVFEEDESIDFLQSLQSDYLSKHPNNFSLEEIYDLFSTESLFFDINDKELLYGLPALTMLTLYFNFAETGKLFPKAYSVTDKVDSKCFDTVTSFTASKKVISCLISSLEDVIQQTDYDTDEFDEEDFFMDTDGFIIRWIEEDQVNDAVEYLEGIINKAKNISV